MKLYYLIILSSYIKWVDPGWCHGLIYIHHLHRMSANRVIKVADFGLSEDIYTNAYYRQSKTDTTVKLPVKWMPPESIADGIFTEKSDIVSVTCKAYYYILWHCTISSMQWSFGVTCWEIFTGGQIPYGGIRPAALFQLLHDGERLNKPMNPACSDEMWVEIYCCCHHRYECIETTSCLVPNDFIWPN